MNDLYSNPIGQKARGGQAPPAAPPPRVRRGLASPNGGGGPAKPGHASKKE